MGGFQKIMVLWQAVLLFLAAYTARDGFATKSHSTTTQYHQLCRLPTNRQIFVAHFLMTYCYLHFSDSQVWRCGTHTDNTQVHNSITTTSYNLNKSLLRTSSTRRAETLIYNTVQETSIKRTPSGPSQVSA